jgi:hypothetical protein
MILDARRRMQEKERTRKVPHMPYVIRDLMALLSDEKM